MGLIMGFRLWKDITTLVSHFESIGIDQAQLHNHSWNIRETAAGLRDDEEDSPR